MSIFKKLTFLFVLMSISTISHGVQHSDPTATADDSDPGIDPTYIIAKADANDPSGGAGELLKYDPTGGAGELLDQDPIVLTFGGVQGTTVCKVDINNDLFDAGWEIGSKDMGPGQTDVCKAVIIQALYEAGWEIGSKDMGPGQDDVL